MYKSNENVAKLIHTKNKMKKIASRSTIILGVILSGTSLSLLEINTPAYAAKFGQSGKGGDQGTRPNKAAPSEGGLSENGVGGAGGGADAGKGGKVGSNTINDTPTKGQDGGSVDYDASVPLERTGGGGGAGLILEPGTYSTRNNITGGTGGDSGANYANFGGTGDGGAGGAGVILKNTELSNNHIITRGAGGRSLSNPDVIANGTSFPCANCREGRGGDGGAGVVIDQNSILNNTSIIAGGTGGETYALFRKDRKPSDTDGGGGDGGDGGNGVELKDNNVINNSGQIIGGKGGTAQEYGILDEPQYAIKTGKNGEDGIGVYAQGNGNHVINKTTGIIAAGGNDPEKGKAVRFEGDNNTFEIWNGSKTKGSVEASGRGNELRLGGTEDQNFNFSDVGGKYKGFDIFGKNGTGVAHVSGQSTFDGIVDIEEGGIDLVRDGSLSNASSIIVNGTLDVSHIDGEATKIKSLDGTNGDAVVNLGGKELILTDANGTYAGKLNGDNNSKFNIDKGHETLTGDNSGFMGNTTINGGSELTTDQKLGGTTEIKKDGTLSGNGPLENLINGGTLVVGSDKGFETKTIDGDYVGKGGTIVLNTQLGGDNSPTDRLDIRGNSSGQSNVKINNRDGLGAKTVTGIPVITVGGQSDGQFNLLGDYKLGGQDVVIGGAYAYRLQKGGDGGKPSDYSLVSSLKDVPTPPPSCDGTGTCPPPGPNPEPKPVPAPLAYGATVPLYSAYTQALRKANAPSTLQERVGNRYWSGAGARQIAQGDGPGLSEVVPQPDTNTTLTDYGLFWSKISGSYGRFAPANSTTGNKSTVNTWTFTAGVDNQLYENEAGRFIGGVWFEYGRINARVSSRFGNGEIKANGYGGGASLTWYGDDGLYVDGQGKLSWYKSDIDSETMQRSVADGTKGFGYALSVETGKRFAVSQYWSLTPQAQLSWSSLKMDNFTDTFNATSSFGRQNDLIARFGLTADYVNSWQGDDGFTRRSSFYAGANLYQGLVQDESNVRISVSGRRDETSALVDAGTLGKTWLGIGAGGTYSWHDNKYSLFSNVNVASSTKKLGDNYTLSGNVGLSVKW